MEEQRGDLRAAERLAARDGAARWAARAAAAYVLVAAALAAAGLVRIVRTEPGLPLWDEAAQGFAGLEAADALARFRPLEFLAVLNRQVVWPFVHALLLLPGFALLGPGFDTPAMVSAVLFGLTAALVFAAGLALHPARGAWIGALAAGLLIASPAYRLFGTLGMLEMPGAALLALSIALHVRCAGPDARRPWLAAAGASTAALFLLKYNYGLLWLGALLANEWFRLPRAERRERITRAAAWLRAGRLLRPGPLLLATYLAGLAALSFTGGFELTVFSRRVSVHSPGNPAYALLVILTVWAMAAIARDPAGWRARWRSLPERHRVLLATVGAPLWAWFLVPWPNRVRALADFVANRHSGPSPWSLEGLLYYPRAFATDYSPAEVIGWAVFLLSLVPPRRSRPGAWLLYIALAIGFEGTAAHRYHQPRFLFTTALLVWLNAARAAVQLATPVLERAPRWVREPAWVAALVAALALLPRPEEARVRAGHRAWRTSETLLPVMDQVLDRAAREPERAVLLGYSYALSPGLLAWRAREVRPELPTARLPRRAPWLPADAPETEIAARLDRLLAPGALVLAALPTPGSAAYTPQWASEVWADSVTAEGLGSDPGVAEEGGADVPVAGFRLSAFRVGPGR
ncbi:MAG TPA: hypothetical protein VGK89_01425 [Candidatus Eisenbacteria bacterium]